MPIDFVSNKLYTLKHKRGCTYHFFFQNIEYHLQVITKFDISDTHIIRLLSLWRKKSEQWFPSIFRITYKGTEKWLLDQVVNKKDRILFLIKVKNQYIGHIGLNKIDGRNTYCDIDNIVRGVSKYPGIMENAIRHMMHWGHHEFNIHTFMLTTTSDNVKSLALYKKLGFIQDHRIAKIKIVKPDRIEWQNAPNDYIGQIERYDVVMKLLYENI